jgi:dienelactone hydrolase/cytochrome c553
MNTISKIKSGLVVSSLLLATTLSAVNIGSCVSCHGANFEKKALGKSKVVKDMSVADVEASLLGYKNGTYGGAMKGIMKAQVAKYSEAELKQIAAQIGKKDATSMNKASGDASEGKYVTYSVDGIEYEGYYISPKENAPLVYMIHDWDGVTEYEIKRAKMLSELGYAVFAADVYGKGVRPTKVEDKKKMAGSLYKDREKMRKLLDAGFAAAKSQGANTSNALGTGYCFGGACILEMARSGADLKAFVPFHGNLFTPKGQDYTKTKGSVYVFHGGADKVVKIEEFAGLATELEAQKIDHEMIVYSGAPHAFTVIGSKRYHKEADEKSWKRFQEILKEEL